MAMPKGTGTMEVEGDRHHGGTAGRVSGGVFRRNRLALGARAGVGREVAVGMDGTVGDGAKESMHSGRQDARSILRNGAAKS